MQKSYNLYHNLGYWFLSLVVLVFAGFYFTYFSVFFQPKDPLIHIHFTLMALWILMLIVQPFLIKYKKAVLHRSIGKISYVLVPLLLGSAFLMIRYSYHHFIAGLQQKINAGHLQLSNDEILKQAASYEAIALMYLLWFGIFYTLAIINKRKSLIHSRYMLATALTMLGPTVDRILYINFKLEKLPGFIPVEFMAFFIADILLLLLFLQDIKRTRPVKTLGFCLLVYLAGQVLYVLLPGTDLWTKLVTAIM